MFPRSTTVASICSNTPCRAGAAAVLDRLLLAWPLEGPVVTSSDPTTKEKIVLVRNLHSLTIMVQNDKRIKHEEAVAGAALVAEPLLVLLASAGNLARLRCNTILTELPAMTAACAGLRELDLRGSMRLVSLDGVQGLPSLERLSAGATPIDSLSVLKNGACPRLRVLDLGHCKRLSTLQGLEDHPSLTQIVLFLTAITTFEGLRGCHSLVTISAHGCVELASIAGLEDLPSLETLDVSWTGITSLKPLLRTNANTNTSATLPIVVSRDGWRHCPALRKVTADSCTELTSLDGLEGHRQLESVSISHCSALSSVKALLQCPSLMHLNVLHCDALTSLDGLDTIAEDTTRGRSPLVIVGFAPATAEDD